MALRQPLSKEKRKNAYFAFENIKIKNIFAFSLLFMINT